MFAYCGNNPVNRIDKEGTDWKDWVAIGLGVVLVGIAIVAAVPTGGGSLVLAAAGIEAATAIAVGEAAVITGTIVTGAAVAQHELSNISFSSNKHESGSREIDKQVRIDYEYNGNGTGNVHAHIGNSKAVLWTIEKGVGTVITVSKAVKDIIRHPEIQRVVTEFIRQVKDLAQ